MIGHRSLSSSVVVRLRTRDRREYQLTFPTRALHQNDRKRFILHFTEMDKPSNGIRLFVDCQNIGLDTTEIPIRSLLRGNLNVVSVVTMVEPDISGLITQRTLQDCKSCYLGETLIR